MPQLDLMIFFSELFWITLVLFLTLFSIKISLLPNLDILTVSELLDIWSVMIGLSSRFINLKVKNSAAKDLSNTIVYDNN